MSVNGAHKLSSSKTEIKMVTYSDWEPWYAWHPVTTISGRKIWLNTVYRRYRMIFEIADDRGYDYGDEFDILKTIQTTQ